MSEGRTRELRDVVERRKAGVREDGMLNLNSGDSFTMRYIDMSGKLPMCRRTENAQVRYSAAYPTGGEHVAKGTSLQWGLDPIVKMQDHSDCSGCRHWRLS